MNKKRIVCFFLGMMFALLCLQGCQLGQAPSESNSSEEATSATSESTEKADVYLISDGVCEYSVVYAANSDNAKKAANRLAQTFQTKYKITLKIRDASSVTYDADAKEIYVGDTGFAESDKAAENLKGTNSYCITGVGNKFVIVAGKDGLLMEAVEYYVNDVLPGCVSFSSTTGKPSVKISECIVKATEGSGGLHSSIRIGDVDLKRFTIVYQEEEEQLMKKYAESLRDSIVGAYGVNLPVVGDQSSNETKYEILVGNTNRAESAAFAQAQDIEYLEYDIGTQGDKYVIVGGGFFSVKCGVQRFANTYLHSMSDEVQIPKGTVLKKEDFVGTVAHAQGSDLRIMTYNVLSEVYAKEYYGNNAPTPPERIEILMAQLEAYAPDVVGLQEMTPWWQKTVAKYLDPNEWGTYSPTEDDLAQVILYRKSRVTLLESEIVNYYPGNDFGRAWMVWGKFRIKSSGKEFLFCTTHWHPTDDAIKDKEAAALAETVVRMRRENGNLPVFCTGDYNTGHGTTRYQNFMTNSGLLDTFNLAKASGTTVNEVNGNGTPGMKRGERHYSSNVDHIFCESYVTVGRFESILENQITNLSDHAPRYADVSW